MVEANVGEEEKVFNILKIRVVFGLGNVGRAYSNTRHNIGFDFLEFLSSSVRFLEEKSLNSLVYKMDSSLNNIRLVKPNRMMNASGEAVSKYLKYYNVSPEEALVVHDDLDLQLGNFKIQFAKGPKVHNGIASIENRLGTTKFWRLRIGIENRDMLEKKINRNSGAYVLSRFSVTEGEVLRDIFAKINLDWKQKCNTEKI